MMRYINKGKNILSVGYENGHDNINNSIKIIKYYYNNTTKLFFTHSPLLFFNGLPHWLSAWLVKIAVASGCVCIMRETYLLHYKREKKTDSKRVYPIPAQASQFARVAAREVCLIGRDWDFTSGPLYKNIPLSSTEISVVFYNIPVGNTIHFLWQRHHFMRLV